MTEKEVQLLGFEKHYFDNEIDYYYVHDITAGLSFISSSGEEAVGYGQWFVEVFNTEHPVRFYKFEEVQSLINLLEKHLIRK